MPVGKGAQLMKEMPWLARSLRIAKETKVVKALVKGGSAAKKIVGALKKGKAAEQGAKAGEEGAETAYHYTFAERIAAIEKEGLRAGSYTTPNGSLSPLQAQIDLALSPNQGLRNALVRIDLARLRGAGYDIPKVTRIGRGFNMPGGDFEMVFKYRIPPKYIEVIRR